MSSEEAIKLRVCVFCIIIAEFILVSRPKNVSKTQFKLQVFFVCLYVNFFVMCGVCCCNIGNNFSSILKMCQRVNYKIPQRTELSVKQLWVTTVTHKELKKAVLKLPMKFTPRSSQLSVRICDWMKNTPIWPLVGIIYVLHFILTVSRETSCHCNFSVWTTWCVEYARIIIPTEELWAQCRSNNPLLHVMIAPKSSRGSTATQTVTATSVSL